MNRIIFIVRLVREIWEHFRKEKIHRLLLFALLGLSVSSVLVFYFEPREVVKNLFDAYWWAVVTMTTVGYGDIAPKTIFGRLTAFFLMGFSIVITVLISGTITSIMVDRKMREAKGLQRVSFSNHIVICGWNYNAEKILSALYRYEGRKVRTNIVLINELGAEELEEIRYKYSGRYVEVHFIYGNFLHESVLERANIKGAKYVIILPEFERGEATRKADEKTVLAALAIKNINPDVRLIAELVEKENEVHLKRAGVDEVIIGMEISGYLLADTIISPGIPMVIKDLLDFEKGNELVKVDIPVSFVGRTFLELSEYFRKSEKAILIGIVSERKKITIEDFLGADDDPIDAFIKRKFSEMDEDIFEGEELREVHINPDDNYIIKDIDKAFIIRKI